MSDIISKASNTEIKITKSQDTILTVQQIKSEINAREIDILSATDEITKKQDEIKYYQNLLLQAEGLGVTEVVKEKAEAVVEK